MKFRSAVMLAAVFALYSFSSASAYTAGAVSGGGKLTGKITFSGSADGTAMTFPIEKNPEVCGSGTREVPTITADGSGGLAHSVVYFQKIETGKDWTVPEGGWKLGQKKCLFSPWVQVIPDKSELTVVNNDPILHNIHTYELIPAGPRFVKVTMFNEAQPTQGYTFKKKVRMRRGTTMKVECDAHNFMHAYIVVLKNPYYAVTGPDGSYSIDNIPAGSYKVTVWHSLLGSVTKDVTIAAGGAAELSHGFSK